MFFSPFCPRPRLKPFGKTPAQKLPPNWAVSGSKLFVCWWLLLPMPKPMLTIYRNPLATLEKSLNLSRRRLFSRHLYFVNHFQLQCRCIEKKCLLNLLKNTNTWWLYDKCPCYMAKMIKVVKVVKVVKGLISAEDNLLLLLFDCLICLISPN